MALKRKGHTNATATTFGMMDDLAYTYDAGNKLTKVEDIASLEGFKNGANIAIEYTYDQNGNMLTDANKGITGIVYNHLNLPTQVTMAGQNILYIYDAVGTKLRKTVSGITTDYAGNYVYENSTLQFFNTAEGYVEPNGTGWQYVYQYRDHLGNVRLSYADSNGDGVISPSFGGGQGEAEIREENNFYPFGLKHKGYNNVVNGRDHKYGFGNKEEQDELGLGWIDITARNYDPALGRWMNLDPLAEAMRRHSPYNYAFDNPVYFIDADGLAPSFFDEESKRQNEIDNDCSFRGKCGSRLDDGPVPDFVPDFDPSGPQNLTGNGGRKKPKKAPKEVRFSEGKALAVGDGTETVNTLEEVTVVGEAKNATNCPDCLDPSTIGKNLLGLTYPGGDNPKTYAGDYSYSYVPTRLSEYPAIGHDRRYDNLGTRGVKGLLTDTRAIGADWRFVREELFIASSPYVDPISRLQAGILGIGLGTAALPKTIFQLAQPNGQGLIGIIIWDNTSNIGVTNTPSTFKH